MTVTVMARCMVMALAALTCVAALRALPAEWQAATAPKVSVTEVILTASAASPPPALQFAPAQSADLLMRQLTTCQDVLAAPQMRLTSPAAVAQITTACDSRADAVLARVPSLSLAHLIKAQVAAYRGDPAVSQYLSQSQATAPFRGWLAARRLRFAAGQLMSSSVFAKDLQVVAQDPTYHPVLQQTYQNHPALRVLMSQLTATPVGGR